MDRTGPGRGERGMNTVELMVAMAIVAIGLLVLVEQISLSYRETESSEQRAFAYQKAAAMLQEVQNSIDNGLVQNSNDLYPLVDADYQVVLTTRRDPDGVQLPAEHKMSGNVQRQGHWQWSRKLSIDPHEQPGLYYVKANVYRWQETHWTFAANQTQLVSLVPKADAPDQTFDVYALACAETPSLWGQLSQLRSKVGAAITTLTANSQVRFRVHWITCLGYGRDACYAPFVNTNATTTTAAPYAYWLPGLLDAAGNLAYESDLLTGQHQVESGLQAGWSSKCQAPFAVADQWNHCLRSPAAGQLHQQRVDLGLEDDDALPLQLLLDRMDQQPDRYRGAIFVNLHAPGLPMPPLRNYSDAAKDPSGRPGIRVVAHPALLRTPRDPNGDGDHADSGDVELRVYAYKLDPAKGPAVLAEPILVQIPGVNLSGAINAGANSTLTVRRLAGGINPTNGTAGGPGSDYDGFDTATGLPPTSAGAPYEMYYEAGYAGGAEPYTWLKLYNTPLVAPTVKKRGVDPGTRLYDLDYCPSPVTTGGAFDQDLATDGGAGTQRNTARWRIRVPKYVLSSGLLPNQDQVLHFVTRIGSDLTTGARWPTPNQPANRSETWTWWAATAAAVPITERWQFLGDPRLCPYADLMVDGDSSPYGFNWHFDNLVDGGNDATLRFPCLKSAPTRLQQGFGSRSRADVPRYYALLRSVLQKCGAVYVNPVGAAGSYLLQGGEIGRAAVAAGTGTQAISMAGVFYHLAGTTNVNTVNVGAATANDGMPVLKNNADAKWWSNPWLGELCPESMYATWISSGNVPLGSNGATCCWKPLHLANPANLPYGTKFKEPCGALVDDAGSVMLLDSGSSGSTYQHVATLQPAATPTGATSSIAGAANAPLPAQLDAQQPFVLNAAAAPPPAFSFTDSYPRTTATLRESLWTVPGSQAGAVVDFYATSGQRGFLVPLGFTPQTASNDLVLEQALLAGVRALHDAGLPGLTGRVPELPLLTIVEPPASANLTNPTGFGLRWKTDFLRWDAQSYTASHPPGFAESESDLIYRVLWSADLGTSWKSVLTGDSATPGAWPTNPMDRLNDAATGSETFVVTTPSDTFPTGEYLFRVEAFHQLRQSHHSSHEVRVVIRRQ
ncbi:MAG TPA: type II secretion system protein [Planctomycetota bacterium]|nr:type II secretion system protein [Planctomycetota bacterium]